MASQTFLMTSSVTSLIVNLKECLAEQNIAKLVLLALNVGELYRKFNRSKVKNCVVSKIPA